MSKYIGLIIILLTFSVNIVQAQKTEISGKITEAGNTNPIPYVSILFKGTYTGTMSDLNGNYNLSSTKPASIIEFTAVGLSLIHISEPTRLGMISYAVFCLKKK